MLAGFISVTACWHGASSAPPHAPVAPVARVTPVERWNPSAPWESVHVVYGSTISTPDGSFAPLRRGDRALVWTPDASRYFYGAPDGEVHRCELVTSVCRTIPMPKWRIFETSPDGKRLLATPNSEKEPTHVVDVASGARREVPARAASWLDNDRLVYDADAGLMVFDLRTNKASVLGPHADAPTLHMTPSPDGKYIAYVGLRHRELPDGRRPSRYVFGVFDVAAGAWVKSIETPENQSVSFWGGGDLARWSTDSRRVAFADTDVITIDVKTLTTRSAMSERPWKLLGWVDGKRLAYMKVARIDDRDVRRFGHGLVHAWCDVHVRDVDTGDDTALTVGGAFVECDASLAGQRPTYR